MFSVLLICMGILCGKAKSGDDDDDDDDYDDEYGNFYSDATQHMPLQGRFVTIKGNTQDIAVRLNNPFGNSSKAGRLEIYYSGIWGTVCDDDFTNVSARVACASLGFGYIGTVIGNRYGAGTGLIWLSSVSCGGTETAIQLCDHEGWGEHICDHDEDVSVSCGNPQDYTVQLTNSFGNNSMEGRLEIFYSGRWGTVCDDGFTNESARVACASLGFGYIGAVIHNSHGAGTGQIWLDDVNCFGTETGLEQCAHNGWGAHNCSLNEDVSISCDCGNSYFSRPTGIISSPNFPLRYGNNLDCNNHIIATPGHTVIITFLAFTTESDLDWLTVTCDSGNVFRSPRFSGSEFPAILTISSCSLVNVHFHSDVSKPYSGYTGFSLTYSITSDNVIGGLTSKPSNAFPRSDKNDTIIFNCTAATKYLPWWTINGKGSRNYTITNSTCGVINSTPYSSRFLTETLGPGSCNLIVIASGLDLNRLAGSLLCTDSTLSSARAVLAPVNIELKLTKGVNSSATVTDIIRDEEIRISCNPSFTDWGSSSSLIFTYYLYHGGPVVQMRILRTYWTSQRNIVSSTETSNTSSYVLVKAPEDGAIPRYSCNIVCDFVSNISDISDNSTIELSSSTEPMEVLYWPMEENMIISGDSNGQILTSALLQCNVAANPPATYTWIDESNGDIAKGPTIIVNHGGRYTCNASNSIRGQHFQQSKSINLQVVEDNTHRNPTVLILLGVAVLAIVIIVAILLSRICRQQERNTAAEVGHIKHGNEYELRQRGGESNIYECVSGNDIDVDESGYDKLGTPQRRLPSIPPIYHGLVAHDKGDELLQRGESNIYDACLGDDIDVDESGYDYPDASQRRLPTMSAIYDELEFDN